MISALIRCVLRIDVMLFVMQTLQKSIEISTMFDPVSYLDGAEVVRCQPGTFLLDVRPFPLEQMYNYISARTTVVVSVILA
jgi:hypothetical protein